MMLATNTSSSLRTQGPIATGHSGRAKVVEQRLSIDEPRRMGPGLRRDDEIPEIRNRYLQGVE
jgi:hypothetical protein